MATYGVRPKKGFCGMCGVAKAAQKHPCPFDVSRGKGSHKCDCCLSCQKACEDLIENKPFNNQNLKP